MGKIEHRFGCILARLALLAVVAVALAAVGPRTVAAEGEPPTGPVLVTFETGDAGSGDTYKAVIEDPAAVGQAWEALATDGHAGIPVGTLQAGDGGVNAPHAWHVIGTTFAEITIELCDGTASMVDAALDEWLHVGSFCPWSTTILDVQPYAAPTDPPGGPDTDPPAEPGPCPGAPLSGVVEPVVVTFATAGGQFRAVLEQPRDIALAQEELATGCEAGVPTGELAEGDGGVNAPHGWHMVGTVFADVTIELCDGTPADVDADLGYWIDTVGRFCPWSATVIDVQPYTGPITPPGQTPGPTLCDVTPDTDGPVVVTFETGEPGEGDTFRAILTDPTSIALAREELATGADCGFPIGVLVAGPGGVNAPHAWHLEDAVMVEGAIEACSARASYVDETLDYWLAYGSYCPWSAQAIAIEPLVAPSAPPVDKPETPDAPGGGNNAPDEDAGETPASTNPTSGAATTVTALPNTGAGPLAARSSGEAVPTLAGAMVGILLLAGWGRTIRRAGGTRATPAP